MRMGTSLIANTVRAVDAVDAVTVGEGPEGRALVLVEHLDSGTFETRLYLHDGWIVEEYAVAGSPYDPAGAVQVAASQTLFLSDHHLLLTSSTASGKTEAAFFPILSSLYERPPQTVGALYIAPLKSLITAKFYRLDELLDLSGIPVTRWHGDVAMSH